MYTSDIFSNYLCCSTLCWLQRNLLNKKETATYLTKIIFFQFTSLQHHSELGHLQKIIAYIFLRNFSKSSHRSSSKLLIVVQHGRKTCLPWLVLVSASHMMINFCGCCNAVGQKCAKRGRPEQWCIIMQQKLPTKFLSLSRDVWKRNFINFGIFVDFHVALWRFV